MAHWQLDHKDEAQSWCDQSMDWVERAQEKRLLTLQSEARTCWGYRTLAIAPIRPGDYSQAGTNFEKQGQKEKAKEAYSKAIDYYEQLLLDFPAVPAYRTKLVDLLTRTGRVKDMERVNREAVSRLEKLAAAHPKLAQYRLAMGEIYGGLRQWDKAAAEYTKAIDLNSKDWNSWNQRAYAYLNQQRWDQAAADYTKAIEQNPNVHTTWFHRGHAHMALKKWDEVIVDFSELLKRFPGDVNAVYYRGWATRTLATGTWPSPTISRAIGMTPRLDAARVRLAWLLAACPEARSGIEASCELAKKLSPQDRESWKCLARHIIPGDWHSRDCST